MDYIQELILSGSGTGLGRRDWRMMMFVTVGFVYSDNEYFRYHSYCCNCCVDDYWCLFVVINILAVHVQ